MKKDQWIEAKSVNEYDDSSHVFFTKETQEKIIEYITNKDLSLPQRNKIYEKFIDSVFEELVLIMINTFNFKDTGEDVESLVAEVKVKLYNVLEDSRVNLELSKGYDDSKGSAYSYFSRTAKNYLIQKQKKNQDLQKKRTINSIEEEIIFFSENLIINEDIEVDFNELIEMTSAWFLNNIRTIFEKNEDVKIALSVVEVLKNNYTVVDDKKSLVYMIKQQCEEDSYRINKVINVMIQAYNQLKNEYLENFYFSKQKKVTLDI